MKPSFALDFRDGLVTLLHRTSRGWSQVGATSFDAPDFVEALGYLRSTALGLSPRGITTKLIIPNDQILYRQVHAPGPELPKRKRQIKAALEGQTPYPLDDLVYDWWGTGPEIQVAVVARETLAEAEAFAAEHRFNPVSFAGVPDNGAFLGEPFFGPTAAAATLLAEGEKVERDSDPVTVIARDYPRSEPAAPAVGQPAEPVAAAPAAEPATSPAEMARPEASANPQAPVEADSPKAELHARKPAATEPAPESVTAPASPAVAKAPESIRAAEAAPASEAAPPPADRVPAPRREREPRREPEPFPRSATTVPTASWPIEMSAAAKQPDPPEPSTPESKAPESKAVESKVTNSKVTETRVIEPKVIEPIPEAPMAMDVAPSEPTPEGDDIPPAPAAEIVAAFASRRTAAIAAATAGMTKAAPAQTGNIPSVGSAPTQRPSVPRPSLARPASGGSRETLPFPPKTAATAPKAPLNKSGKAGGASVTAPGILGVRRQRNVVAIPTAASTGAQGATAQRASGKPGFGLGSKPAPVKGKPKYLGLILTGLLLLLLAAVAAWSSFFMVANDSTGTGAGSPPASESSGLSSLPATPDASSTAAGVQDGRAAPSDSAAIATASSSGPDLTSPDSAQTLDTAPAAGSDVSAAASATPDVAADQTGTTAEVSTPATTATGVAEAIAALNSPDAAAATVAKPTADPPVNSTAAPSTVSAIVPNLKTEASTMGIAAAEQSSTPQDNIVVASADIPPRTPAPLALPAVAAGADASPAAEPPPPPYGTVYKFDAEGRIVPTPEGILTPEGVLLIAGKPKMLPPDRPADLTPAPDSSAGVASTAAQPGTATPPDAADPAGTSQAALPPTGTSAANTTPTGMTPTAAAPTDTSAATTSEAAPAKLPQDPTLRGKHPKDRPADLTPPASQQGTLTDTSTDIALAGFRPTARPAGLPSPIAADTGADASAASASLAANGFALTSSPKPPSRPSGLKAPVDAAVEAALNAATQNDVQLASSAAPIALDEPEIESKAPDLPTNASVAKQATTKRALKTSRVALLAVFGSPSTRFAMIRQSNGAVKKVQIGDRVDGGRIGAITENSVQYTKGGQIVTLSLPTG